jgi:phenylpropionate dioxygenase-like ring-hydroxylating dioxygenase large terminal subunit
VTSTTYDAATLREAHRHSWFAVARSEDLRIPRPARLLDQDLAVFRDANGSARVIDRRCVHRGGDLAAGQVTETSLQCPYHGWCFEGSSGACSRIPSLPDNGRIPANATVRSYPVQERFGHVWTSLGEPVFDLPDPPAFGNLALDWRAAVPIPAQCGFMAATENFRDVAHFPFVHKRTMGPVGPEIAALKVERDGREVRASHFYPRVEGAAFSDVGDAWMHYHAWAPGFATIVYDFGPDIGRRYLVDFPSPVSHEECVIFWAVAKDEDFTGGTIEEIMEVEKRVFDEDTPILEGLRPREVPLAGQAIEVSVPADAYTLNYRRATKFAVDTILASRSTTDD